MSEPDKHAVKTTENGAIFYGTFKFPISRAVRAGDFVITSAFPCYLPEHDEQVYTDEGIPLSTGKYRNAYSFGEEVNGCFKMLIEVLALADCGLSDVVDCQVWLKDPRDFAEFNRIYVDYFTDSRPIRSVFQNHFMMEMRIEMKMIAFKPLGG
jgi:2-iminobutanoate/2-iminopropanoate deaminase